MHHVQTEDASGVARSPRRAWQGKSALLLMALLSVCAGCSKRKAADPAASAPTAVPAPNAVRILAGSELKDLAPALQAAALAAGVPVTFSYAGTLEIVERISAGEVFDMILPANGAYPTLALPHKPLAREKLFYSRVALGLKQSKTEQLGWHEHAPSWAEVAAAVAAGKLHYGMTSPSSSNTGMSALFAVACAVAKKTEDLTVADVRAPDNVSTIKQFLAGQRLTAGSSGWLAEAYVREQDQLDGLINYEAVILRLNARPDLREKLSLIYPADGVISADYPLLLLREDKRAAHAKLVEVWRALAFQNGPLKKAFLRPANPDATPAPELPSGAVAELSYPNNLEVIDEVLLAFHGDWRRAATSIFALDTSGSMDGGRIAQLRAALKVLSGADTTSLTARYARFQTRERAVLIPFASQPAPPERFEFGGAESVVDDSLADAGLTDASRTLAVRDAGSKAIAAPSHGPDPAVLTAIRGFAEHLRANGGTAIYSALIAAYASARAELVTDPERVVTILLLTDGENRDGASPEQFEQVVRSGPKVRVFPILFGEANDSAMERIAAQTGGRVFDGTKNSLAAVFKEIRGYQ